MPHLRAALIAFFLLIHGILVMPWPQSLRQRDLEFPEVRQELDLWHELITGAGIAIDRDRFGALVVHWSGRLTNIRSRVRAPIRPFNRITGTGQGWALFAGPDTHPHRLVVEGRVENGAWEILYRRADPEHDLLDGTLRYRRLRGVYDGASNRPGRAYRNFTRFAARAMFQLRPDLYEVRVSLERSHTTLPWQRPDPQTERRHERTWSRTQVLP